MLVPRLGLRFFFFGITFIPAFEDARLAHAAGFYLFIYLF